MASQVTGRSALVLYGSETGNAQDVAEELGRLMERLRFSTQVSDLDSIDLAKLLRFSVVIISISTTGQGDIPANAQLFWKKLRSVRLRPGCLKALQFTIFGLGDTSYPKFNWAGRKVYNRLLQLGAQPFCERGEADEQHPEGVDGSFIQWFSNLRQRLLELFPLPAGVVPIPDDVRLEPKWVLNFADGYSSIQDGNLSGPQAGQDSNGVSKDEVPPDDLLPVKGALTTTLLSNSRLTPEKHWQDVRHLTFSFSTPISYAPGDVLTIYPKNFPSDVSHFITLMNWDSIADTPLQFVPTQPITGPEYPPPPLYNLPTTYTVTLRTLLTNHLDIMSIPRRSFFAHLAHFTDDPFHRDRLLEFTNPEYIDELYDYTTRPRRSILEVLQEFESVKIPWQQVCSVIPFMRGRQFSIASGGSLKTVRDLREGEEEKGMKETRVELLIAIVKYKTVIKRIRQGVATRYIASLQSGQQLNVTLSKGGLHVKRADLDKPVVMVGPGTGIAPMRAMVYERLAWKAENQERLKGDILFFGCRNEDADYFFREEWKKLEEEEGLSVIAAFSRDQRQKVYVQDLIRKHAAEVYEALGKKNGMVYICGSSGKMPQAIREALIEVFQGQGGLERQDAEAFLLRMEKEERYNQETW